MFSILTACLALDRRDMLSATKPNPMYIPYTEGKKTFSTGDRIRVTCPTHPHFNREYFVGEVKLGPNENVLRTLDGVPFFYTDVELAGSAPTRPRQPFTIHLGPNDDLIVRGAETATITDERPIRPIYSTPAPKYRLLGENELFKKGDEFDSLNSPLNSAAWADNDVWPHAERTINVVGVHTPKSLRALLSYVKKEWRFRRKI